MMEWVAFEIEREEGRVREEVKEHLLNRTISFVSRCVLDMMMMGLPTRLRAFHV